MHTHEHVTPEEALECLIGCSSYKQYYTMRQRFENGPCAFCSIDRTINTVLYGDEEGQNFYGWEVPKGFSSFGEALSLQFVFFPKRHLRHQNELNQLERDEYWRIIDWVYAKYEIPGGGIFCRIGDMRYTVGTVPHIHFNVWVPNRKGPVVIPLQKDEEMRGENIWRAEFYATEYESGKVPEEPRDL